VYNIDVKLKHLKHKQISNQWSQCKERGIANT